MGVSRKTSGLFHGLGMVLLAGFVAGCQSWPVIAPVRGQVTYQNKPVTEGTITFFNPETGFAAEAPLGADGSYTIKNREGGLAVGDYRVMITPPIVIDDSEPTKTPPASVEKNVSNIPTKYRRHDTPLRATVVEGENVLNFNMTP